MFGGTPVIVDEKKIDAVLTRGVDEVIPSVEELKKMLMSGKRLRIKLGIDPTSPNLHFGRSVPLLKLKDFQDLGHHIVLIVGDATGVIGDTSDKKSERPMLSRQDVKKNAETYFKQAAIILGTNFEKRFNSEWLNKISFSELGEMANQFSVAEFIARDNIKRRLDEGSRVSLRETLYPLMQGYDSVAIKADIELGGVDQRFNLLAGRTLQEHYKQKPQGIVMTEFPIEGLDGRKMSSSWGNTIAFTEIPDEMFGKVMSIKDELVEKYFRIITRVPLERVGEIVAGHPRDAKIALAHELVQMYHGEAKADKAKENFIKTFSNKEVPEEREIILASVGTPFVEALTEAGIVKSKNEARRLIAGGALSSMTTEEVVDDEHATITKADIFRLGKKKFFEITLK